MSVIFYFSSISNSEKIVFIHFFDDSLCLVEKKFAIVIKIV